MEYKFAYKFSYPTARRQVLYLYGQKPDDEKGLLYSTKAHMINWLFGYWNIEDIELVIVK